MAEKIYRDFTGMKKSAVKAAVREMLMEDFKEFLAAKYTKFGKVAAGEMAVVVGHWTDEDGFDHEVPAVVKAIAKPFYDSVGEKERVTEQYVVEDQVDAYADEIAGAATRHKGRPKKSESES